MSHCANIVLLNWKWNQKRIQYFCNVIDIPNVHSEWYTKRTVKIFHSDKWSSHHSSSNKPNKDDTYYDSYLSNFFWKQLIFCSLLLIMAILPFCVVLHTINKYLNALLPILLLYESLKKANIENTLLNAFISVNMSNLFVT